MSTPHEPAAGGAGYRASRQAETILTRIREPFRRHRVLRWGALLAGLALLAWVIGWVLLARDMPDAETLLDYEPPLPSVVRGIDGGIVHSYARERRVQLQFKDLPPQLLNAYTSAEDKTFWSHGGIDLGGFVGAVIDYASKIGSGERAVGGSTITQQVAKNILVGNEYSVTRKLKEMILARRIEDVLSKREIITLYLNEIALGRRTFGVQAAARAYFDKDVADLTLPEMAFLAILPKAPETYSRSDNAAVAVERRNWVLDEMADNGHISEAEAAAAKSAPLGLMRNQGQAQSADAGYFLEEVRRQLIERYGEQAEDGQHSVYAGGLWVRTSLDTGLQAAAQKALRAGMLRYQGQRGWNGPIATIDLNDGAWQGQLASSYLSINYQDWRVGVVTQRSGASATIGFADGEEAPLTGLPDALEAGDVIVASPSGNSWRVRDGARGLGRVRGTGSQYRAGAGDAGRVRPAAGATSTALPRRLRQPGSTIKPFVYATGLDNGMTPATLVPDRQYCYYQGANLGEKCFTNFGGSRGGGEYPMRYGLEQSKNLMTVHIAMDAGMDKVTKTFSDLQIGDYDTYPAFALGAGDTTVIKMVNAYSTLANQGRMNAPTLIDYVQDRSGEVIWRADQRECPRCNMDEWGRLAHAAPRARGPAGDGCAHRLPGRQHAHRRGPARHRHAAARSRPQPVRQDRHLFGSD